MFGEEKIVMILCRLQVEESPERTTTSNKYRKYLCLHYP